MNDNYAWNSLRRAIFKCCVDGCEELSTMKRACGLFCPAHDPGEESDRIFVETAKSASDELWDRFDSQFWEVPDYSSMEPPAQPPGTPTHE